MPYIFLKRMAGCTILRNLSWKAIPWPHSPQKHSWESYTVNTVHFWLFYWYIRIYIESSINCYFPPPLSDDQRICLMRKVWIEDETYLVGIIMGGKLMTWFDCATYLCISGNYLYNCPLSYIWLGAWTPSYTHTESKTHV